MNTPEDMVLEFQTRYDFDSPKVIGAMLATPRDKFISPKYKKIAYDDRPIDIGYGQTMSQPYTVAFMTDLLLEGRDHSKWNILEVGTGSGYQAAVLSRLVKEVYTVEIIPKLAVKAQETLVRLGYKNIKVNIASGEFGWKKYAPYDGIIVTAGVEGEAPRKLFEQLKVGGVLVAPVGKGVDKMMTRYTKRLRKKEIKKLRNKGSKNEDEEIRKTEHGIFHFVPFVKQ